MLFDSIFISGGVCQAGDDSREDRRGSDCLAAEQI